MRSVLAKFLNFNKKNAAARLPAEHPDPHFRFPKGMIKDQPTIARYGPTPAAEYVAFHSDGTERLRIPATKLITWGERRHGEVIESPQARLYVTTNTSLP